jgi:glycosyltransferase involved in cell wall biosynthesis
MENPILHMVRSSPILKRLARGAFSIASGLGSASAELYWEPNHVLLKNIRARYKLLTVHDLSCMLHPEWHPKERQDFYRVNFLPGIKKADMIVTVSDTIRQELMEHLGASGDRVKSVYNGVDHKLFRPLPESALSDFRAARKLPERYLLCVGSLEPRKNLKNLISAWLSLGEKTRDGRCLLLIANGGWENTEIVRLIDEGKKSGAIAVTRNVPSSDLPFYYNNAEIFIYMSFYEGFGLPPLEAMACGVPALVSDIPVHREILADAAFYAKPDDPAVIAECIEDLLVCSFDRNAVSEKCIARASKYDWELSAGGYRAVMKNFT